MVIDEKSAQEILRDRRIERDYCDPRSCAAIVIDLAFQRIDVAFDVVEAVAGSVGYNDSND